MAETTLLADRSGDLRLDPEAKEERYGEVLELIESAIAPERDLLSCMTSVVCLLHNAFPYYYWTGFYRRVAPRELRVGPYQGTMGCLSIHFDRGVCGACARERRTMWKRFPATLPATLPHVRRSWCQCSTSATG